MPTLFNGRQHCFACGKRLKFELVNHLFNGRLHCLACDKRKLESVFNATAPLYQPYLGSDCSHSPPQVLGSFCVHGVKVKIYPLPSEGSEDVAIAGGAQPKPRDTTSLQRRVWGSDVRLMCARATETHLQKSAPCKRTLSTTHTNQGCVHTVKCVHRGHTIQHNTK